MFSVPIIPPDLRHEETIIQAAHALNCLQKTINSVFDRIDQRITTNNDKVQNIEQRILKAQTKIKGLVGTKKAIRIYSPARFPATHVFHDIPLTFKHNKSDMEATEPQKLSYEVKSRVESLPSNALDEKLEFFHVRTKETPGAQKSLAEAKKEANQQKGMGTIPENLKSVNSLLLFNSEERIFAIDSDEDLSSWKRAKLFKNHRQNATLAKSSAISEKQLIEPAPYSLVNKQHGRSRLKAQNGLFYTPRLNEAPEIDLPLDLPDLPGIADDIHFEGKDQQQIAPSLFIDNLPDLQELESTEMRSVESNKETLSGIGTQHQQHSNAVISSASAAPPPPPPPQIPPKITSAAPTAPPPPPPPPPLLNSTPTVAATSTNSNLSSTNSAQSSSHIDTHSNLMDAIRKAGGTRGGKLRAAADVVDKSVTEAMHSEPVTGDLMADLRRMLVMRRKGISGAKDSEAAGAAASNTIRIHSNPVINRLSALIPPPPPVAQRARNTQITDDDDDADESNDADWNE